MKIINTDKNTTTEAKDFLFSFKGRGSKIN